MDLKKVIIYIITKSIINYIALIIYKCEINKYSYNKIEQAKEFNVATKVVVNLLESKYNHSTLHRNWSWCIHFYIVHVNALQQCAYLNNAYDYTTTICLFI